jgi:hypothetical protein
MPSSYDAEEEAASAPDVTSPRGDLRHLMALPITSARRFSPLGAVGTFALWGLKQLDWIAGRVLQEDLLSPVPAHDVITKAAPYATESFHRGRKIVHLDLNAVPAAGRGKLSIGHRLTGTACAGSVQK